MSTVYYFFTGHSDVVIHGRGFRVFLLALFGYWNRDEEMRWRHQSEARHAFLKRDDFLLGLSRLKHYFHYESYIDKPRPWWHWVRNGGTHFFAGHLDTQTESRVHPDRKCESSSRRTPFAATTVITPVKKTETVRGFVGLNISRLIIRRYPIFIIKFIPNQTLKYVITRT